VKPANRLIVGDNLDILQSQVKDESVDVIYVDPPFCSGRPHLHSPHFGGGQAFDDTWKWGAEAEGAFDLAVSGRGRVAKAMRGLRLILGESDTLAYLSMLAPRLVEMKRVLRRTGSAFVHIDQWSAHYVQIVMDAVFGSTRMMNEIIWERCHPKAIATKRLSTGHDVILVYGKGRERQWNHEEAFHK
jgi:DNA modification methylase